LKENLRKLSEKWTLSIRISSTKSKQTQPMK